MKKLLQNGLMRCQQLVAHAGGAVDGITLSNSLQVLDNSYKKGFKFIELDFEWTADRHLVAIHDWGVSVNRLFGAEPKVYSLKEFSSLRMVGKLKQMTLADLALWLLKHPGTFIITDVKKDNIKALRKIALDHKEIQKNIIPQIYSFDEYDAVKSLGFKKLILTLYKSDYSDDAILEFVRRHPVSAVTMPVDRVLTGLPLRLHNLGVFVYTHTINNVGLMNKLKDYNVDGFYTDLIRCV